MPFSTKQVRLPVIFVEYGSNNNEVFPSLLSVSSSVLEVCFHVLTDMLQLYLSRYLGRIEQTRVSPSILTLLWIVVIASLAAMQWSMLGQCLSFLRHQETS